jgi:chitin disaccharide deacetylase
MSPGRVLVVNADDYGLTEGVSRAVLRGHREGIVTSTSALVVAPAFADTAYWLADVPTLGVGAHLAVVGEDPPVLSAAEVPTLVDRRGRLDLSWRAFLPRLAAGRVDLADVEREFEAQLRMLASHGVHPTHVDTHQHVHLWPSLGRLVVELARRHRIPAVRVTRSAKRSPVAAGVRALARRLEERARTAGLAFPTASAGFDEGGRLTLDALVATVERLAATGASSAELGLHPGEHGDADLGRYRWGYRWGDELDAVTNPAARAAVERAGFRLGTYADVVPVGG